MSGIVWLALDGVGHPADAPPGSVWEQALPTLRPVVDAGAALDATLGVPGLPQSGTGQACWLTGTDAVALMGEHYGPHPGPTLQRLLRERSLPVRLARTGARIALANHYVPAYFEAQAVGPRRNRMGCFPYAFRAAGADLNPPGVPGVGATLGLDYRAPWRPVGTLDDVARLGAALAASARTHDLIAVDLWFSDALGHEGMVPLPADALAAGRTYLTRVDALLAGLLDAGARVALSSDHGNLEDLRVKGHTVARVPFAAVGVEPGRPSNVVQGGQAVAGWFGVDGVEITEF
ncbi:hypothetical protein HNQ07_003872 [Deinococcus metalli]|uniref:Metalloenzyme domain-containing protein n=1 Tax=Deinococcus metalli TaxID=1141878 RepID=A0A7W8NQZ2_9DEIO|nr:metalloenzyme domain protein [Deinococcus metalli]MBB5378366.1 hypothetical protein [Deinococcus metalli]GHF59424.1 hypothetical protein GCM10017781_39650 [Deinococcus metalli]